MYFQKKNKFFNYIFIIFPLLIISGPAIPELIIFGSIVFFFIEYKHIEIDKRLQKIIFFLFCFQIYLIFSSFISDFKIHSLKTSTLYIRFIIFSLILFFFLENKYVELKSLLYVLISTFFLLFVVAIIQFIIPKLEIFNFIIYENKNSMRITSLFGDEQILGSFIVKFLPLIFLILFKFYEKNFYIYFFIINLISFFTIFLSGERTSIFLFLFLNFLISIKNFKLLKINIFTLILILTIIFFNQNKFSNQINRLVFFTYNQIFNSDNLVKQKKQINVFSKQHEEHYINSISIFKENIFFGVGPNNFRLECKNHHNGKGCSTHPHNFFFQFLAELGLFGIFILIITYFWVLFLFLREKNFSKILNILPPLIILCPFVPAGNFFNNYMNIIFFFICTVSFYEYFKNK